MVYLFIGQDSVSKDLQLKKIKQEFLAKGLEQFNLDTLYAKELILKDLQQTLLCLPVKSAKRIIVIKDVQDLREESKEFILRYIKTPQKQIVLILDVNQQGKSDEFINRVYRYAKTLRFKEIKRLDTFTLSRLIEMKKPDYALRALNQLLKDGVRPEWILGGLRYVWERGVAQPLEMKKRLNLLLDCDRDIKTGRLRPNFALEKLIICLCGLGKSFH